MNNRQQTDTKVCIDDYFGPYDAKVDLSDRWNGWLCPSFTLDTVRALAARSQELAHAEGHDVVDTIHVIEGGAEDDGTPRAIVVHVRWQYFADSRQRAAQILTPDSDGRYGIGAAEWTWSLSVWWCSCGEPVNWHLPTCGNCEAVRPDQPA